MPTYEIPLKPQPQMFQIPLAGTTYKFTILWNVVIGCWVLDIASSESVPLLQGLPLVTGADLLAPHQHLGFDGSLFVMTDGDVDAIPTFVNLGSTGHLRFVTP